ncbi:hypothetical protein C8J56DRAFT_1071310 [Mycena floridula]|nr:hypothetical protein C8J56DRAFT_1071310 [Mycena floridula]
MNLRLTTVALAVFAVHAAVGTIVSRDDSDSILPECVSRCAVVMDLETKFPEDECTGECQTYACTQPKVDAIADCLGCLVAYDTTGNSLMGIGQLVVDDFVTNCTAVGFPLSKVTVVATKNPDSVSQSAQNTAQSQSQTKPSQLQTNPAPSPSQKNVGVSLTAVGTMTVVISAVVGAFLA